MEIITENINQNENYIELKEKILTSIKIKKNKLLNS